MNYERPKSEFIIDQKGTQEEMNDIEESLSDITLKSCRIFKKMKNWIFMKKGID